MKLTAEEINSNYNKILAIADKNFSEPRKEKIKFLLDDLGERFSLTPASGVKHYHGAFPGGLIVHTLGVIKMAVQLYELWNLNGSDVSGYTQEELIFSCMFHDLGKVGDEREEYFIPNKSEWHIKNQGKIYEHNPNIVSMTVPDRSLYMLQSYGIPITQQEFIAIKTHDGLFDEGNKYYWSPRNEHGLFETNLPIIVHQADYMSYRIELENMWSNQEVSIDKEEQQLQDVFKTVNKKEVKDKKFKELFND